MLSKSYRRRCSAFRLVGLGLSAALLGASLWPGAAWAQESEPATPNPEQESGVEAIITDRPDFTESTETVPAGMTQVEGGLTFSRAGDERGSSFGEVLIRHALGRKAELRVEAPTFARNRGTGGRESGFEDGSIGFKYMLSPGGDGLGLKRPRVSLIGAANVPIGSRQFRQGGLQPGVKLLLGADLSQRLSLSSNLNYAYLKDSERFHEFSASLSLGMGLSERLGSYVEVFGFLPSGERDSSRFINGGFTYQLSPDFQLDARLGLGLGNDVGGPDTFLGLGLARRF